MNHQPDDAAKDKILERVVEQFTQRLRSGEQPSIEKVVAQHPELHREIHELLSSVAMIEELKQQSDASSGSQPLGHRDPISVERLGDYRITRELGRGGMGVVLEAIHESLGRRVAIKVLHARLVSDQKYLERFRREAQAAATLHHTNIVSVFGVGQSDGYHYYVMEFVNGCGLNQIIQRIARTRQFSAKTLLDRTRRDGSPTIFSQRGDQTAENQELLLQQELDASAHQPISDEVMAHVPAGDDRWSWAAELIGQIADALDYAHEQGKLHRDIKPSNLLLDRNGQIWLTDFGLVKNVEHQALTKTGDIIGTPQYMAPESFAGRYDRRSESYCLGLTLYELITLRPAFGDGPTPDLIRRVTSTRPLPPQRINPRIPRDLDTIIQKAIERDADKRYQSAGQLADDLRAFVENRPIAARRLSAPEKLWRWTRRNPWAAVSAVLIALVAITASIGYLATSRALGDLSIQHVELEKQKTKTDEALQLAKENAEKTDIQFARAESNVALALEMIDSMFYQTVFGGNEKGIEFAFDGFHELSGIETAVTARDAESLEHLLGFYEKFAEQNAGYRDLELDSARAYRRVANIYHVIGKYQEAVDAYQRSLKLFDSLQPSDSQSISVAVDSSNTRNEMSAALRHLGNYRDSLDALRVTQSRLSQHPRKDDAELRFAMAKTLNLLGSARPVTQRNPAGKLPIPANGRGFTQPERENRLNRNMRVRDYRIVGQGLDILESLIAADPERLDVRLERAKGYGRLAELYFSQGEFAKAADANQVAVAELVRLVETHPENASYMYVLAQLYAMPTGGTTTSRKKSLKRSLILVNRLTDQSSRNLDFRQLEAEVNAKLGKLALDDNDKNLAIEYFSKATEALGLVIAETPLNRLQQEKWSVVVAKLAELLMQQGRLDEAKELLQSSILEIKLLAKQYRRLPVGRWMLLRHYQLLAQVLEDLGDTRGARQASREARQILTQQGRDRN